MGSEVVVVMAPFVQAMLHMREALRRHLADISRIGAHRVPADLDHGLGVGPVLPTWTWVCRSSARSKSPKRRLKCSTAQIDAHTTSGLGQKGSLRIWFGGRPGGNRTPNPRIRNPMLYPLELRALEINFTHFTRVLTGRLRTSVGRAAQPSEGTITKWVPHPSRFLRRVGGRPIAP
jgi:hypothetical protein